MNKQSIAVGAVALVFIAIGAYFGWQKSEPVAAAPSASALFFSHTLQDSSGAPQALKQWQGKPLVINFWASWCPPCVREMPELSALQQEIGSSHVQIIGVGIDTAENITAFSAQHPVAYPLYVAGNDGIELSRRFGNHAGGLPFTVLLGADGSVKHTYLGVKIDQLRRDLNQL